MAVKEDRPSALIAGRNYSGLAFSLILSLLKSTPAIAAAHGNEKRKYIYIV